ncbi:MULTISPECIES: DUF6193 family natural product biosynthesis protein [Streptomyces]|uniref:Uncharacterized protein n=1 Tax=Streptomyces albidoflavus TaxID=1886 RepID=A0AA37C0R0_9ACTN|nr:MULTISPECIES: DUF6193 family natural product biosynthesis protein [Streptomyces]MBV7254319.1 hypothetical protein [Streptomyces sp. S-2]NEC98064.1 hypothetical protein [Streptomyces albidoflavus]RZE51729.1 hypothetical protein C0Q97_21720 [Streptomyces albidoflavus]RZE75513.1 hypothetical protein C0R02_21255 [Streptomyces albidoflavus]WQG73718.1 DUF6193 family natural product biosynthesis protein [Streptomyces albidoflavus]
MRPPPDPALLYPDVMASGSLAAVLREAAAGCLATLPDDALTPAGPLHAAVSAAVPHRAPLAVSAWAHVRRWSVRGTEPYQGMCLVDGWTHDLAEVARAARAWRDGVPLEGIRRAAPFVHLTGRFEVPDNDPVRLAASEWQHLRREAYELEYDWREPYQALIEAAHASPALRALYPFTSHWVLRFSTATRPRLALVGPCLTANADGTYGVGTGMLAPDLGLFATAPEAVACAVRQLPSGLGPVAPGE